MYEIGRVDVVEFEPEEELFGCRIHHFAGNHGYTFGVQWIKWRPPYADCTMTQ